jgi:ferric-dicitrate binding protein FerR (iron transport regulator)
MDQKALSDLLERYNKGEASKAEIELLESWYLEQAAKPSNLSVEDVVAAEDLMAAYLKIHIGRKKATEADKEVAAIPKKIRLWQHIAAIRTIAAAAVLLVAGFGAHFYTLYYAARHLEGSEATRELLNYANDIAPGKNTATITLANGSTIVLSDAKTGVVVGVESLRYNDNSLVQGASGTHFSGSLKGDQKNTGPVSAPSPGVKEMLTATTPRGGTYQITLPDGTKVWLNAASSLKFPASFAKLKDRRVELVGEGYFEVAKDKAHPFIVKTDKQEVEVLGTHFNINSYADEASTKTTLLEGSVRVVYAPRHPEYDRLNPARHPEGSAATRTGPFASSAQLKLLNSTDKRSLPYGRDDGKDRDDERGQYDGSRQDNGQIGKAIILKPNQQSVLTGNNQLKVESANVNKAIAWKNGKFVFEYESIESVMRKLARWYDAEIIYQGNFEGKTFTGSISRFDSISKILEKITYTQDVHFKIEGRRITVMP